MAPWTAAVISAAAQFCILTLILMLILTSCVQNISAHIYYDQQTLLDIRAISTLPQISPSAPGLPTHSELCQTKTQASHMDKGV